MEEDKNMGISKLLPPWVKCMHCGGKPTANDWLIEVVPNSNALAHQSCAKERGLIAGIDQIGTIAKQVP